MDMMSLKSLRYCRLPVSMVSSSFVSVDVTTLLNSVAPCIVGFHVTGQFGTASIMYRQAVFSPR